MNHLAHVLLAGPDEGMRIGAFLGDHVKGRRALGDLPGEWAAGVMLHRRIDSISDGHAAVTGLLERMAPPWRRYGGVILDVLFDHMLTRHWQTFGVGTLEDFGHDIDALLHQHASRLPDRLVLFSRWAERRRLWARYGEHQMIDEIFRRLARRHGRPGPLADGIRVLERMDSEIEQAFLVLFPDLQDQVEQEREPIQSSWSSI